MRERSIRVASSPWGMLAALCVFAAGMALIPGCAWMSKPPPLVASTATPDEIASRLAFVEQRNAQIEAEAQAARDAGSLFPGVGTLIGAIVANMIASRKSK